MKDQILPLLCFFLINAATFARVRVGVEFMNWVFVIIWASNEISLPFTSFPIFTPYCCKTYEGDKIWFSITSMLDFLFFSLSLFFFRLSFFFWDILWVDSLRIFWQLKFEIPQLATLAITNEFYKLQCFL